MTKQKSTASTTFKKGVSGNISGRPKGSLNKSSLLRSEFERRAEEDLPAVYDGIMNAIKNGEGWAYSLFFKECLAPKKKDTALVSVEGDRLPAFLEGLKQFQELTYDEILKGIQSLTSVRLAEKLEEFELLKTEEEKRAFLDKMDFVFKKRA